MIKPLEQLKHNMELRISKHETFKKRAHNKSYCINKNIEETKNEIDERRTICQSLIVDVTKRKKVFEMYKQYFDKIAKNNEQVLLPKSKNPTEKGSSRKVKLSSRHSKSNSTHSESSKHSKSTSKMAKNIAESYTTQPNLKQKLSKKLIPSTVKKQPIKMTPNSCMNIVEEDEDFYNDSINIDSLPKNFKLK